MTRRRTPDLLNSIARTAVLAQRTRADYRAAKRGGAAAVVERVARRKWHAALLGALRRRGL